VSLDDGNDGADALIDRLKAGDRDAFESVVREQGGRMLSVARRMLRDEADAQDAVQDAFVQAIRNIDKFEGRSTLSTWLHRITVNAALMSIRRKKRKREDQLDDDGGDDFDRFGHRREAGWQEDTRPDELLLRSETRQVVRDAIDTLPDNYRIVLVLRDIEELDTETVADMLEMTPGAVKTRLHRARGALKKALDPVFGKEANQSDGEK
jgi:RNA polymerase sigma-70 factor (ECF subfamily)